MDTTAQLVTPPGKGGIAVISLAGPRAGELLETLFRPMRSHESQPAGSLQLGHLLGPDGQVLDEAVVQRDDERVMINIHGGPYVTHAALELLSIKGARVIRQPQSIFEPGHHRWDNPAIGREMLDLLPSLLSPLAVSAVAGQWSGGLSRLACQTSADLIREGFAASAGNVSAELRAAAGRLATMRRMIEPAEVVLAGVPNSGKSTLANALSGQAMSIVHETPGTTRDWVRELVLIDGVPIWLTDTAGIWEAPVGPEALIDAEAVRRAIERLGQADLIIMLGELPSTVGLPRSSSVLRVWPKADVSAFDSSARGRFDLAVSAMVGTGMDELRRRILQALGLGDLDPMSAMAFTDRQARLLLEAADAIEESRFAAAGNAMTRLLREDSGLSREHQEPLCRQ